VTVANEMIPFNRPFMTGRELDYIRQAHAQGQLAGNGPFTRQCQAWLEEHVGCARALLTHSCTAALEMSALLLDLQPGDEVIMPSYTFVSTANAFVLRGAVPVFVDIRPDTLNLDENLIEQAITERTRAICVVHYAGVACEMDAIMAIADRHGLAVVEDAAQAVCSRWRGKPLGSLGHLAAYSFHETKNVISGEGGALLINDERLIERAEILWEKGTNRSSFFRGEVDKYTWMDVGSSFLPGELVAAFLHAQLQEAEAITRRRLEIWRRYHEAFGELEEDGLVRRPIVPDGCVANAHMYYLLLKSGSMRDALLAGLREDGVHAVFHYVPLHDAPAGRKFGRTSGEMRNTIDVASRIVRLPLWPGVEAFQDRIIAAVRQRLEQNRQAGSAT